MRTDPSGGCLSSEPLEPEGSVSEGAKLPPRCVWGVRFLPGTAVEGPPFGEGIVRLLMDGTRGAPEPELSRLLAEAMVSATEAVRVFATSPLPMLGFPASFSTLQGGSDSCCQNRYKHSRHPGTDTYMVSIQKHIT